MVARYSPRREDPLSEQFFDRYRIDTVSAGGMGAVYAVTDERTGRRYAFKSIKPELRRDPVARARFVEEAGVWIALGQHEHLVEAYWLIEEEPGPFLVLEYVDGPDLATLLAETGPLPLGRALDFALQCAKGLGFAHSRRVPGGVGVIHRDLKPSNLLIAPRDVLKVGDFGLARIRGATGDRAGGTPAYMAPEQLREAVVDGRADIYSFGLVLYEMITGANPLLADTVQEQVRRALHDVPPPLTDVPHALGALVAQCAAKDPAERPSSFTEVMGHLAVIARDVDYRYHIDPQRITPPAEPSGLAVGAPRLRPRRPRAGDPCSVEIEVRGDVGRGPVEFAWTLPSMHGLETLTPGARAVVRVDTGGPVLLRLRHHLLAPAEGTYAVPESVLVARGPAGARRYRVPAFEADIAFAFVLPLAGRGALLKRLHAAVDATARGEPRTFFLFGDVGAGKSRLLREVARRAVADGLAVIQSRAQLSSLRPMRVLNDMARAILETVVPDAPSVRVALHALLGDDNASVRYFTEMLAAGVTPEPEMGPAAPWAALVRAASARMPLVLLMDSLHRSASTAIRIVVELAVRAHVESWPVLLCGTVDSAEPGDPAGARSGELRAACTHWRRHGVPLEALDLDPLDRAALDRLIEATFPGHGFDEDAPWFAPTILRVTRGNVFHVVEILRALRDSSGAVRREGGDWHFPADFDQDKLTDLVPDALDAVVRARLDVLPAAAREVVDAAALLGEEFDAPVVARALGKTHDVASVMSMLEETEIAVPVAPDADRYRFFSASVPTVVSRRLDPDRTRALHGRLAAALLRVHTGGARLSNALKIAKHLRAAGEGVRSLPFTLAGSRRLLSMHLAERARRLLANAKALAADPETEPVHRAYHQYLYGLACTVTGDYDEGFEALTAFVESGESLPHDRQALPRAYVRLARIHQARGDYDDAQYCLGVAREIFRSSGDRRRLAFVLVSLAELSLERGRLLATEQDLAKAVRVAAETGNEPAGIRAQILQGHLSLRLARPADARHAYHEAEQRARALGDERRLADALEGLGLVALKSGYLKEAQDHLEQVRDLYVRMGDRQRLAGTMIYLGDVQQGLGQVARALRQFRRAEGVFRAIGHPEGEAAARFRLGRVYRARGHTTDAIRELAAAAEGYGRLRLPERWAATRNLARALADAGSDRLARVTLAHADRGEEPGAERRGHRVESRTLRAEMALRAGDLRLARCWAVRAANHARRTTGHVARIAARLALAEVALCSDQHEVAAGAANDAIAFAREHGDPLAVAAAERTLGELAARQGHIADARAHAHRAARAYTGRSDAGAGPAKLLHALRRGMRETDPVRSDRYGRAAHRCYARLERQGFRPPSDL